jgi:hypothetical protein
MTKHMGRKPAGGYIDPPNTTGASGGREGKARCHANCDATHCNTWPVEGQENMPASGSHGNGTPRDWHQVHMTDERSFRPPVPRSTKEGGE